MSKNVILMFFNDSLDEKCKYLSFSNIFQVLSTHFVGLPL